MLSAIYTVIDAGQEWVGCVSLILYTYQKWLLTFKALHLISFPELSRMIHGAKNDGNMKVVFYEEAEGFALLDRFMETFKTT